MDALAPGLLRSNAVTLRALGFAIVLLIAVPAGAAWVELTPQQADEAIAHGRVSYERARALGRAIDDLDPEYVVNIGADIGRALQFTEIGRAHV